MAAPLQNNVVDLHAADERPRYSEGWRAGKPEEDPEKLRPWGFFSARPSEFLVCMRGGEVVRSGQGLSVFKWPWESVAVVPTTVQRIQFTADQVTNEKVGVQVTGLAVYRIAEPLLAAKMLNFSFPERAQEKLERLLGEMFVGATRRLVSNMTVEQCMIERKEGIAAELIREIAPVISGAGQAHDSTTRGWGVVLDNIEIQDVRILSHAVFANLQAGYRQEQERIARHAELSTRRALQQEDSEAQRQIALAKLTAENDVRQRRQQAEEAHQLAELAAQARVGAARLAQEKAVARGKAELEVERARLESDAEAARHAARMKSVAQEAELNRVKQAEVEAAHHLREAQLQVAEVDARARRIGQELELEKLRGLRDIDNRVSSEAIPLTVAQKLPELAAAFQQKLGEVHITAVDGANPFGYIAAAVEGVMGLARSAGLKGPAKP